MKKVIRTEHAPAPIGPYNQAIEANGMVFISGQIGMDTNSGELLTDEVKAETKKVMANLGEVLNAASLDYSNIVKTSIFLSDMSLFAEMNEVYATYFDGIDAPARETVAVKGLPKGVNVEISAIAIR